MPRKTFRRLIAYSLSGHASHFVWLSALAIVSTAWIHLWTRYGARVKEFIFS